MVSRKPRKRAVAGVAALACAAVVAMAGESTAATCAPSPPSAGGCGGVQEGSACVAEPGVVGVCHGTGIDGGTCQCVENADPPGAPGLSLWGALAVGALGATAGSLALARRAWRRR